MSINELDIKNVLENTSPRILLYKSLEIARIDMSTGVWNAARNTIVSLSMIEQISSN